MKFTINLEVKVDKDGLVTYQRPNGGSLYLGQVIKDGDWRWEIPTQHRTEILPGRHHEDWSGKLSKGVETKRIAVLVLVSFHWARGYLDSPIQ